MPWKTADKIVENFTDYTKLQKRLELPISHWQNIKNQLEKIFHGWCNALQKIRFQQVAI
jgi:hypothetical protein